jgi:hypothetical protein
MEQCGVAEGKENEVPNENDVFGGDPAILTPPVKIDGEFERCPGDSKANCVALL